MVLNLLIYKKYHIAISSTLPCTSLTFLNFHFKFSMNSYYHALLIISIYVTLTEYSSILTSLTRFCGYPCPFIIVQGVKLFYVSTNFVSI